jgi:hypothetical protein
MEKFLRIARLKALQAILLFKFELENMMNKISLLAVLMLTSSIAFAKLPAPSDEAKAKAAEAAAKTAHTGKVDGYLLCKSQDKVAANAQRNKKAGKAVATPPCADPGAFVYTHTPAAALAAPAAGAAPAAPAPAKKS